MAHVLFRKDIQLHESTFPTAVLSNQKNKWKTRLSVITNITLATVVWLVSNDFLYPTTPTREHSIGDWKKMKISSGCQKVGNWIADVICRSKNSCVMPFTNKEMNVSATMGPQTRRSRSFAWVRGIKKVRIFFGYYFEVLLVLLLLAKGRIYTLNIQTSAFIHSLKVGEERGDYDNS